MEAFLCGQSVLTLTQMYISAYFSLNAEAESAVLGVKRQPNPSFCTGIHYMLRDRPIGEGDDLFQ